MSEILTLDETIEVARPLHEVYAYISRFSTISQWDPAVACARRLSSGPPAAGDEYQIDMKLGFSLRYRIVELEPQQRMLMDVQSRFFTAREEITFCATAEGTTEVRYVAQFRLPRSLAAFNRLFPSVMERVGSNTMEGMRDALTDRYAPPSRSPWLALSDRLVLPGLWRFTRLGYQAAKKQWLPVSAHLADRHALVTGASSGIGYATARALAALGMRLTLVGRNNDKMQAVARALAAESGNSRIEAEICDLSVMSEVHGLADRLLRAGDAIDILVNNAGALFNSRGETEEGLERSFALLLLSPYILTERLRPLLAASSCARVVNVTSGGMYTQKFRVDDLQSEAPGYSGPVAYARAKRGLMMLTEFWSGQWEKDGITVNAMHPGWADTPGVEDALPGFYRVTRKLLRTPEEGADTAVWLATSTEAGKVSGELWLDRQRHPAHLSGRTRESETEKQQLLKELARLADRTKEGSAA